MHVFTTFFFCCPDHQAMAEVDVDTASYYRRAFDQIHGYMPESPGARRAVVGGILLFISGFMLAKMAALSVLFVGSSSRCVDHG